MPNFQVPQFIEQKAKIIGPLTLGQFFFVAAAAAISLGSFYVFDFFLAFLVSAIAVAIGIALAFVKINGQSLPNMFLSAMNYWWHPRTYTWQRISPQKTIEISSLEKIENLRKKIGVQEKLKSIALSVVTRGGLSKSLRNKNNEEYQTVTFITGERRRAKKVDY